MTSRYRRCPECCGMGTHMGGCPIGMKEALNQVDNLRNLFRAYCINDIEDKDINEILNQFDWMYNVCTTR